RKIGQQSSNTTSEIFFLNENQQPPLCPLGIWIECVFREKIKKHEPLCHTFAGCHIDQVRWNTCMSWCYINRNIEYLGYVIRSVPFDLHIFNFKCTLKYQTQNVNSIRMTLISMRQKFAVYPKCKGFGKPCL